MSEGLQNALWELGSVPLQHRTDRLSTAVNNLSYEKEFTSRYEAPLRHYRMNGQKIHRARRTKVEQRHHRLKRATDQGLMLRGSRECASSEDYKEFLRLLLAQLSAGRRVRLKTEMQYLNALPERRMDSSKRVNAKVDSGSLIYVNRNVCSVNSRLIGEPVEVRLGADIVEFWYAGPKSRGVAATARPWKSSVEGG